MTYSVHKIEKMEDFRNLKSTWSELLNDQTNYRPFLDHDWFELWLDHFKDKHQLLILLVKDNDSIKAICPLLIKKDNFKRIPVKKLELIGNIYSPIRNIIFEKIDNVEKEKVMMSLFSTLRNLVDWDLIDLNSLPEEDFDFEMLNRVLREIGFKNIEYFCFENWFLNGISFSGEQYLNNFTSKFRHSIKYREKELRKKGDVEFRIVKDLDSIDQYVNYYYEVYSKSWQKGEEVGPTFHRDLARLAAQKGWLRLGFLFLQDLPIAAQFWIVCNRIAYILKTVYDQRYKQFSPGKILTLRMFIHAIDIEKVSQIDYLHGDDQYKIDWVTQHRNRKGILIFNNTSRGIFLSFLLLHILPAIDRSQILKAIKEKIFKPVLAKKWW